MKLKIALVIVVIATMALAHRIETTARPDTGRTGVHVDGEHEH